MTPLSRPPTLTLSNRRQGAYSGHVRRKLAEEAKSFSGDQKSKETRN